MAKNLKIDSQEKLEVDWAAVKKSMGRLEHQVDLLLERVKSLLSRVDRGDA